MTHSESSVTTQLALERTSLAQERTLMAWIRTSKKTNLTHPDCSRTHRSAWGFNDPKPSFQNRKFLRVIPVVLTGFICRVGVLGARGK